MAAGGPERHPVSVLGRGSRVIGGTVSVEMDRQAVSELLRDGFFPRCRLTDQPQLERDSWIPGNRTAVRIRYGHHPSSCRVSGRSGANLRGPRYPPTCCSTAACSRPTPLRQRAAGRMSEWFGEANRTARTCGRHDLDFAVARGAAYYGWAKQHGGVRIRGGTHARITSASRPPGWRCRGPHGRCEHFVSSPSAWKKVRKSTCRQRTIGLVLGEPAHFRFFSSSIRKQDQPGDVLRRLGTRTSSWRPILGNRVANR